MEGSTHLTARLSRRLDDENVTDIYAWDGQGRLHEKLDEEILHTGGLAFGTASMSPADVAWLRDALRRDPLGLTPSDREVTLRALRDALEGFEDGDTSPVFEYSWTTDS